MDENRDELGRFKPGRSGNLKGRPRKPRPPAPAPVTLIFFGAVAVALDDARGRQILSFDDILARAQECAKAAAA